MVFRQLPGALHDQGRVYGASTMSGKEEKRKGPRRGRNRGQGLLDGIFSRGTEESEADENGS